MYVLRNKSDCLVMFEDLKKAQKDKLKAKAYATIMTNYGGLNVELHGDRAPKTVYNFIMLAKTGRYDNVPFHRNIQHFMVCDSCVAENRCKEVILREQGKVGNHIGESHLEMNMMRRGRTRMTRGVFS
jgi:cyclophilin family peptidyl-prolyl cis-trans isomerase